MSAAVLGLSSCHTGTVAEVGYDDPDCLYRNQQLADVDAALAEIEGVKGLTRCQASRGRAFSDFKATCDVVRYAVGGNYAEYKRANLATLPQVNQNDRGEITEFSDKSRRRMLKFLNSVDREKLPVGELWFMTLTYPSVWPGDWKIWKAQLKAFRMRLDRTWGNTPAIWKVEPQRRGAPHFHLILWVPKYMAAGLTYEGMQQRRGRERPIWTGGRLSEFRTWCSLSWFEVVGSGDEKHLAAGTNVEPMQAWKQAISYAAKYLGKWCAFIDRETGEQISAGKFWGVWRREEWPVSETMAVVPEEAWKPIRRTIRRYIEKQTGRKSLTWRRRWLSSASVFISSEMIARLIDHHCWWRQGFGWRDAWDARQASARIKALSREMRFHT